MARKIGNTNKPKDLKGETEKLRALYLERGEPFPGDPQDPEDPRDPETEDMEFTLGEESDQETPGEYQCGACGASLDSELPQCPICGNSLTWE